MASNPSNPDPRLTLGAIPAASSDAAAESADRREVLQALLAFSTLHEQIRRRRAEESRRYNQGSGTKWDDGWDFEQFVLDEVLQLVAERSRAITGADGVAIALAEGGEIVCRASVGPMTPDRGVRLNPNSGFSGACFRTGKVIRCDDSETDPRVNIQACRRLGTRSMVAVPLRGQDSVVGLLEAFSTQPYGFNDTDVHSLRLLGELVLGALRPEEEDRIVQAARAAATTSGVTDLERLWQLSAEAALPPERPLAPPPPEEETPLEFASAALAPDLYVAPASRRLPQLLIGLVAVAALLSAGGLWWRGHRSLPPREETAVASATQPATAASAVPVRPEAQTLPSTTGTDVKLDQAPTEDGSNANSANAGPVQVKAVRHWSAAGATTVAVELERAVQYEAHRLPDPERIYFDLPDTTMAPGLSVKPIEVKDGLLNRIRVAQVQSGVTRVVLEIKPDATYSVSLEQNPSRLLIEVRSPGTGILAPKSSIETPAPVEKANVTALPATAPSREDLELRPRVPRLRIVLDAGHGGWDLGTVGRKGLLEKDLVLEVAQRLGNLLEDRLAANVIFTRRDDNYVPLEQRAEMANRAQADLFVSVHANYSELESARGVETYFSNFFVTPEARAIDGENTGADSAMHAHLTSVELKGKVEGSRKLAASVQHALYSSLVQQNPGIRNRGVREASFVVLTGTQMPSVLAEISFVSSPADEERLRNAEYRQKIAEALYMGIERYAASSNRTRLASTSTRPTGK